MEPQPNNRGRFVKGNKRSKGRPPGPSNRAKVYPFMKDGGTTVQAQRFRALAHRMATDLGGHSSLTEAQSQLVRRCAMLSTQCELMEQEAAEGQPLNTHLYATITSHLTRTLSVLGLKREPIDVTPALHQYLDTLPVETSDSVAAADEKEID